MKKTVPIAIAAMSAGLLFASAAGAVTNLVKNGGFETSGGNGQVGFNTSLADWSVPAGINASYTFVFAPGTADTTGALGSKGLVKIWGPGDGSANGLTVSPDGGNFVAADPAYHMGALSQKITGLKAGKEYKLTFDWAGAQQAGFNGVTTEGWKVKLGSGATQTTAMVTDPSHGFTGWMTQKFTFTADGSSDVLSFLSVGGPSASLPPFALLDGVSLTAVPEPATWAFMLVGFGGLGAAIRHRRKQVAATA